MANKLIHMSKLRQVLKLHCQGQTKLQISTVTGLSRNKVKKYLHILDGLKTTWEEVNRLNDKDLDELFCKQPEEILDERLSSHHDFFKHNDKLLRQRGMTLLRLWGGISASRNQGIGTQHFINTTVCGSVVHSLVCTWNIKPTRRPLVRRVSC